MVRRSPWIVLPIFVGVLSASGADARSRLLQDTGSLAPIAQASPVLAPFQHIRFCLRYPADCNSRPAENDRIKLDADVLQLLGRVSHDVNASIIPVSKSNGSKLEGGWSIAPDIGDCNDYAVTKRHELVGRGLPSNALRLAVVRTASGIGHLVLVVVTTSGDIVLDNLTEAIRPWQRTDYHWLKIQSATDPRFWYAVRAPAGGPSLSPADGRVHLADR
jgi:predicted transglutaminase-like cysteine proteinase